MQTSRSRSFVQQKIEEVILKCRAMLEGPDPPPACESVIRLLQRMEPLLVEPMDVAALEDNIYMLQRVFEDDYYFEASHLGREILKGLVNVLRDFIRSKKLEEMPTELHTWFERLGVLLQELQGLEDTPEAHWALPGIKERLQHLMLRFPDAVSIVSVCDEVVVTIEERFPSLCTTDIGQRIVGLLRELRNEVDPDGSLLRDYIATVKVKRLRQVRKRA